MLHLAAVIQLVLLTSATVHSESNTTIGSYRIELTETRPLISVYSISSTPHWVIWFTSPSTDELLVADRVQEQVIQNGGDYIIRDKVLERCNESKVDPTIKVEDESARISGMLCQQTPFNITFSLQSNGHLGFNVSVHTSHFNKITLVYGCGLDEGVYGLGQQYTYVNNRGHSVPLFISEQGVGRGAEPITKILDALSPGSGGNAYTTYSRVPFYFTSYHRALYIDSLDYALLNLTGKDTIRLTINSTSLSARIIPGNSPLDIITSFTAFAGRMQPLPDWVHNGSILGLQGGTKVVTGILNRLKEVVGNLDDVAGVWLQDWTGQRNVTGTKDLPRTALWWNWEVDRTHYPDWEEFIAKLRADNIRVLTYINPLFNNVSNRGTPYNHNYYEEGLKGDYFIRHAPSNEVWKGYSNSCMTDFTDPEAYSWIMEMIIRNMIATNVSGWMCDFGESVPLDAALRGAPAPDPAQYHNIYSEVWARLNKEAVEKAVSRNIISEKQGSEIVYFMRSGSTHSPRVTPLFWLGDQMVTWDEYDGLGSAITGAINSGLSGYSLTHSDIGGYTSIKIPFTPISYTRSAELLSRWCEFAAFTVVYRSHLGTLPDDNVQIYTNNDTIRQFFRMAQVFEIWNGYRYQLIQEAVKYGWPVIRHLMLVFPDNPSVYKEDLRYQYMLGTEVMVAPVHVKEAEHVRVFFPKNVTWVNVWDLTHIKGEDNWKVVHAPIGYPAVYVPKGSKVGQTFADNLANIPGPPYKH